MIELHAFAVSARLLSFNKAAKELCVTQGAISRAIQRLEDHFGRPLFDRTARGISLTDAGQFYLKRIGGSLKAIEQASAELGSQSARLRFSLSVAPTLASNWLLPRLPDFQRRHPEIRIEFVPYSKHENFNGATPDAIIRHGAGEWKNAASEYIIGRELLPICHPERLRALRFRTPEDLLTQPLLFHTNSPDSWRHWFAAQGLADARPLLAAGFDQVNILTQAVIADMGIAIVQRCLITEALASSKVAPALDRPFKITKGYYLCCPRAKRSHPAIVRFKAWLIDQAALDIATGPTKLRSSS